jgi:tetratricopeptide (TPR) repeat protein
VRGASVADGHLTTSKQQLMRYGAIAAVIVAVAVGALYLLGRGEAPPPATTEAGPAQKPPVAADEQTIPSSTQSDQLVSLVGEARRLAAAGKFDEAEATLQKADKVIPHWSETEKARSEIAQLRTPEGQLKTQLERARLAIEHDDRAAAEKALAEAERLNAQAPQIAELRQALQQAEQKDTHRSDRVTELLTKMREDISRGDLAAADGDLNAAERVNVQDPAIREARRELARAREAKEKEERK